MTHTGLPCLDLLEATPGILRGLMSELTDGDARWKPAPDLHEWALHDLGHIRQIAELARARKYLEGAGPLGSNYHLKP